MVITSQSTEVFAICESSSTKLPDLVLLHHISNGLQSVFISRPFIGPHGVHILNIWDNIIKRVNISHDLATPPTVEELGPLEFAKTWTPSHARFGPLASVFFQSRDCIDIVTYNLPSQHSPNFRRLRYNLDCSQYVARTIAGLHDSTGRIILKSGISRFLVMDLI